MRIHGVKFWKLSLTLTSGTRKCTGRYSSLDYCLISCEAWVRSFARDGTPFPATNFSIIVAKMLVDFITARMRGFRRTSFLLWWWSEYFRAHSTSALRVMWRSFAPANALPVSSCNIEYKSISILMRYNWLHRAVCDRDAKSASRWNAANICIDTSVCRFKRLRSARRRVCR